MIKFVNKYKQVLTVVGAVSVLTICYFQQKQIKHLRSLQRPSDSVIVYKAKVDSLTKVSDSLHWELFPTQIELGRYQVAFTIFAERNPKAAEQYAEIISSETE